MRILVVDDDRDIREFLKSNLEADCFVVDTTGDGEEGSYMGRVHDYDLILLDYILPKKTGYTVCRDIRAAGKATPIIILSVQCETDDKVDLLNAGADDYLVKPFSYEELRSRIRAIMRRPPSLMTPVLSVSDLVLDTARQKVRRAGKEIYLTRKEFALLEYLLRNSGTVISRGALLEHVWDESVDPFSNTVEAHILNLRKKIDKKARKKLIHTVPGRGYKIDPHGQPAYNL
jgi:two-component system, OmpR family, response regulator